METSSEKAVNFAKIVRIIIFDLRRGRSERKRPAGRCVLPRTITTQGSFTNTVGGHFNVGPDADQVINHDIVNLATTAIGLVAAITMATRAGANAAITAIDTAISTVSTEREQMGAVLNRLDHAIANLSNVSTNLKVAKGRLEDADFAFETANLARTQVLQQASMAMLSQANASKQNILALFQSTKLT